MDPFILWFADGTMYFVGMGLASLAAMVQLVGWRGRLVPSALTIAALLGVAFVIFASTPLPWWLYILWLFPCSIAILPRKLPATSTRRRRGRMAMALFAFAMSLGLCWLEYRYHQAPVVDVAAGQRIYVIGDSISAGMGGPERCWPDVLAELSGLPVVSLAQAGATLQSALMQAEDVEDPDAIVILEIGGNDLLAGMDAATYERQLDDLLGAVHPRCSRIVMFELPLPPLSQAIGRSQRSLARKYGVTLIPKRYMTHVLGMPAGTLDGLHLSEVGHAELAKTVQSLFAME